MIIKVLSPLSQLNVQIIHKLCNSMQEHLVDAQTGGSGVKTQDTAFETRNLDERSIVFSYWKWIGHVVHCANFDRACRLGVTSAD